MKSETFWHWTLPPLDPCKPVFLSQAIEPTLMEGVLLYFNKEFQCIHLPPFFSLLCFSKRFMNALLCSQDWVDYQQNSFHSIVLCLNMPKTNYSESDSKSLNQQWLLSHAERDFLPMDHLPAGSWRPETPLFTHSCAHAHPPTLGVLSRGERQRLSMQRRDDRPALILQTN